MPRHHFGTSTSVSPIRYLVATWLVTLAVLLSVVGVLAEGAEQAVQLSVRPVGVEGQYFDLTMEPGETQLLTVELGNHGGERIAALTYTADVYTIINGGFGARLDGEPTSGTTLWLDYPTETIELDPGRSELRSFALSIPADAQPGEYITSIVIQNAEPVGGSDNGVTFNQVIRQVIAVSIAVPGPLVPGLEIGEAFHKFAAETSFVSVTLHNTGNVRLKPRGEFVLYDVSGQEITRFPVAMDSFYAGTETLVEIPFERPLSAGEYTASLTLSDQTYDISARADAISLTIAIAEPAAPQPATDNTGLAPVNQEAQPAEQGTIVATPSAFGLPTWAVIGIAVSAVATAGGIVAIAVLGRSRTRRRNDATDTSHAALLPTSVPPVVSDAANGSTITPPPARGGAEQPRSIRLERPAPSPHYKHEANHD